MGRYDRKRALLRLAAADARGERARRAGYRVEHQTEDTVVVLARIPTAAEHPAELDRFVAPLQAAGHTAGRVALIEEGSGRVVAQRALSSRMRAWHRSATPHPRPALRRLGAAAAPPSPVAGEADRRGA